MADLKTTVTELITGLGMLEFDSLDSALRARPKEMVSVAPEQWDQLDRAFAGGGLAAQFDAAYANGRAFFEAHDGLRGRQPAVIEWKGGHKNPGDDSLPVDLRIDHVFLVSCKYDSRILHNSSPSRIFDHGLRPVDGRGSVNWYTTVAPAETQALYQATVMACGLDGLPTHHEELTSSQRANLKASYPVAADWPAEVADAYKTMCAAVSTVTAARWRASLANKAAQEQMLWRLLRFGPAPYFMLGSTRGVSVGLRVATPWDWRNRYVFRSLDIDAMAGGQPLVSWRACVHDRNRAQDTEVGGHVEVRWGHSRFGTAPEAKVHLTTSHAEVPGYFPLA